MPKQNALFAVLAFVVLVLVAAIGGRVLFIFKSPSLAVRDRAGGVDFEFLWLGDYQTVVSRLRLIEQSTGAIIWEVEADRPGSMLLRVPVRVGANSSSIEASRGSFRVVTPESAETFLVQPNTKYVVQVWGDSSKWFSAKRRFSVSMPEPEKRSPEAQPGATDNPGDAQ